LRDEATQMSQPFDSMLGDCAPMRALFSSLEKLAASDLTVLVLGETGTGKELVARSLHRRSRRAAGPFVALNCAALPATLLESELFGFEKGTFTGAVAAKPGHIESAHGGTLFLDEIAELPISAQAKLLRVLQDRRVQRLGAVRDRQVDVRWIAATHQDLPSLVETKIFRRDLYHRLNEVLIVLPPLRERDGDVDLIADAVLERLATDTGRELRLAPAAREALRAHDWPGNVRELENALRGAVARCNGSEVDAADLRLGGHERPRTLAQSLELATEAAVRASLRRHRGDVTAAAAELDVGVEEVRRHAARLRIAIAE
jgi:transcriptional regulator with PAS, ATPase and Fis domain